MQVFWLSALAKSIGIQVTSGEGLDVFNLIPPNLTGYILIATGLMLSLTVYYLTVCFLISVFNKFIESPKKGHT